MRPKGRGRAAIGLGLVTLAVLAAIAVFERLAPRRVVRAYQKLSNPFCRAWCALVPGWAVIETTGRRTGLPRRVNVGGAMRGDAFWVVAGYRGAHFVRNIEADPKVRVQIRGRWRDGTAQVCPNESPTRWLLRSNPLNSAFLWLANRDPGVIRVDLADRPH